VWSLLRNQADDIPSIFFLLIFFRLSDNRRWECTWKLGFFGPSTGVGFCEEEHKGIPRRSEQDYTDGWHSWSCQCWSSPDITSQSQKRLYSICL